MKVSEMNWTGQKNRFYKLRRVILSGVPAYPHGDRAHIVEISMRVGRELLIQRNRNAKIKLAKRGLKSEHCYSSPIEQVDGFSKLVGLIRLEKYMNSANLQLVLTDVWRGYGEAKVEIFCYADIDFRHYIREHMLGCIVAGDYRFKHLVQSRGWPLAKGAVSGSDWFHTIDKTKNSVKARELSPGEQKRIDRRKSFDDVFGPFRLPDGDSISRRFERGDFSFPDE